MLRAKAIYKGEEKENWNGIQEVIKPCFDFMFSKIHDKFAEIKLSDDNAKIIKIA